MKGHLAIERCSGVLSLQDGGRKGYQRYGLSGSGSMDRLAMACANVLLRNPPNAALLELGHGSGRFRVEGGSGFFAVAGAPCGLRIDGTPAACHRTIRLRPGQELAIEPPREGVFAYLAVAGGFEEAAQLGSVSLHLRAGIGGRQGRLFAAGDRLAFGASDGANSEIRALERIALDRDAPIRVMLGPQADRFPPDGIATFLSATFTVSHRADRMGYQLDGPPVVHGTDGFNIVSDATVAGSIQVPGSGSPIVLMADRQTTGGYPKIATVISADLRRLAQRRPGDGVRFVAVELAAAREAAFRQATHLAELPDRVRPLAEVETDRLSSANLAGDAIDALRDSV